MTPYYPCDECLAYFATERQRSKHRARVHDEGEP